MKLAMLAGAIGVVFYYAYRFATEYYEERRLSRRFERRFYE